MKNAVALVALALLMGEAPAVGKPLTVRFRIDITGVSQPAYEPLSRSFGYTAIFDPSVFTAIDNGTTTATNYVIGAPNVIQSGVFSLLPVGLQTAVPYQIISGRQSDYSDVLFSSIGFSDQRAYDYNGFYRQSVTEMFFNRYDPARGGDGTSDRALTPADVRDLLAVGQTSHFFLFDRIYNPENTRTTYEGTATILNVGGVPEPAMWTMLITGFGAVGAAMRRGRGTLPDSA